MKQTTITLRQDGLIVLRSRASRRAWCPDCGAEAEMIVLDPNADLIGTQLDRWLDSLPLHRWRAPDGSCLICMQSLLSCVANESS